MPQVQLIKQTRFDETPYKKGDKLEVDNKTADRWVNKKIAVLVTPIPSISVPKKEVPQPIAVAPDPTEKEIREAAKELQIPGWQNMKLDKLVKKIEELKDDNIII